MIIAPAGPMTKPVDRADIARAVQRLEAMGFKVRLGHDLFRQQGYLAGPDEVRIDELNAAFRDPEINAVFAGRGGYGTTRILDRVDFDALRRDPKILLGFSDITALHTAISQANRFGHFPLTQCGLGLGQRRRLAAVGRALFLASAVGRQIQRRTRSVSQFRRSVGLMNFEQPSCENPASSNRPSHVRGGTAQGRLDRRQSCRLWLR